METFVELGGDAPTTVVVAVTVALTVVVVMGVLFGRPSRNLVIKSDFLPNISDTKLEATVSVTSLVNLNIGNEGIDEEQTLT